MRRGRGNAARRGGVLLFAASLCVLATRLPFAFGQENKPGEAPAGAEAKEAGVAPSPEAESSPPPRRVASPIEEIVVTAQKREQRILDVPISVSVVNAEFMRQQNITDLRDLSYFVPNVKISTNPGFGGGDVRFRGFGSSLFYNNKAMEQAVGLVLDGVPYSKLDYFTGPLFDLDRVEVLRGPQGTLFGKNTTAGVLNVVTAKPTDEYTGHLDLEQGELRRQRYEAAVGGPVIRGLLNARVSFLGDGRDGYYANTTHRISPLAREDPYSRDRLGGRVQIGLPDLFGADLNLGYERVDFESTAGLAEMTKCGPAIHAFFLQFDPNFECRRNYQVSSDRDVVASPSLQSFVANAGYPVWGWRLEAVAGFSELRDRLKFGDGSPKFILRGLSNMDTPQTTFELRAISPTLPGFLGLERLLGFGLGSTEFTGGFFFQRRRIQNSENVFDFNVSRLAGLLAAAQADNRVSPPLPLSGSIPSGLLAGAIDPEEEAVNDIRWGEVASGYAPFGQMDWHFLPAWTFQFGGRLSHEQKDAKWNKQLTGTGAPVLLATGERPFVGERSRTDSEFTPRMSLMYDLTESVKFFTSWSKGFKAGGFNEIVTDPAIETNLQFQPELATAYEIGTKTRLFDGAVALNVTAFWQTVRDLQLLTTLPGQTQISTVIRNAAAARSRGVEADANWLASDWFTVTGAFGFDDARFLDFRAGGCMLDRPATGGCDLSGKPLFRTPQWTATVVPSVKVPLITIPGGKAFVPTFLSDVALLGNVSVAWEDSYMASFFQNDPRLRQPSFFLVNSSIGFGNEVQGWSLEFTGENLTNVPILVHRTEIFGAAANTNWDITEPPRLFFGTFRWKF